MKKDKIVAKSSAFCHSKAEMKYLAKALGIVRA